MTQPKLYGLREKPKKTSEGEEWESSHNRYNRKQVKDGNGNKSNKSNKPNNSNFFVASHGGARGHDNPGRETSAAVKKAKSAGENKDICRSCKKSFNVRELPMHEAMCLKLGPTESFFKLIRPEENQNVNNEEKNHNKLALPDSQPVTNSIASPCKSFAEVVIGEDACREMSAQPSAAELVSEEIYETGSTDKAVVDFEIAQQVKPQDNSNSTSKQTKQKSSKQARKPQNLTRKTGKVTVPTELVKTVDIPAAAAAAADQSNDEYLPAQVYEEITKWRRNLFKLPKGNAGKRFVTNMTKLIVGWIGTNDDNKLKMLMSMPNLLLQRTSKKSKARENKENLSRRLEL